MRTSKDVEQDRYINNLAEQAAGRNRATPEDFDISDDPLHFTAQIYNRVYVWLSGTITNTNTLARIVEAAIGEREDRGSGVQRITPLSEVTGPGFRVEQQTGSEILLELATHVLCAAIWDHYRRHRY